MTPDTPRTSANELIGHEPSRQSMVPSNRATVIDERVCADILGATLENRLFLRLVAKGRTFQNVKFKYSIFDTCYLRDCKFDSCDFTGCRFVGSNLYGTKFVGCRFDYSWFERTLLDNSILDTGCPGLDNLKLKFARTLRMNYQQIGDSQSANKAIRVELEAQQSDLYKAWHSNESYYRKKYTGLLRARMFTRWVSFKILDIVWGNGESPWKLIRTACILLAGLAVIDATFYNDWHLVGSYVSGLAKSSEVFFGTLTPSDYPSWYLTIILISRLIMFGLFMSILTKRFSRR